MGPGRRKRFRSFKEVERFLGYTLPSKNPEHDRFNETSSEDEAERPKKKSKSGTNATAKKKSSKSKKKSIFNIVDRIMHKERKYQIL